MNTIFEVAKAAGLRAAVGLPHPDLRPHQDNRNLVGYVQHGFVYTGKTGKIAEHGGIDPQDRHVPLVVSGAGAGHDVRTAAVETTRIAPTILSLLGLSPRALQAVRIEHTKVLKLATVG